MPRKNTAVEAIKLVIRQILVNVKCLNYAASRDRRRRLTSIDQQTIDSIN